MKTVNLLFIILFSIIIGCTKKHLFVYSDGYYEDLYTCYVYPSGFRMDYAAHDINSAEIQADYFAKIYVPSTDYIECKLSTN